MKKINFKKLIIINLFVLALFTVVLLKPELKSSNVYEDYVKKSTVNNFTNAYESINTFNIERLKKIEEEELKKTLVYEDLNREQLIKLINLSLNSDLKNKGELIVNYSLDKGVDPVVATSIMLLETGCKWKCSALVKKCYNVGGVKGKPNCKGGYRKYNSLDDGIKKFIDNLANNYYSKGLNTPEKMNHKYAESSKWATKVNKYVKEIVSKKKKVL